MMSEEQAEQKGRNEAQELLKVHGGGAEQGDERIAELPFKRLRSSR